MELKLFSEYVVKEIKLNYVHTGMDVHWYFVATFSARILDSNQRTVFHRCCVDIDKPEPDWGWVRERGKYQRVRYTCSDLQWKCHEWSKSTKNHQIIRFTTVNPLDEEKLTRRVTEGS